MVKIYLTKDSGDGTLHFFTEKPICDYGEWIGERDDVKFAFPDDIYILKRFDLIPDINIIYDLEITEEEFDSFNWYDYLDD